MELGSVAKIDPPMPPSPPMLLENPPVTPPVIPPIPPIPPRPRPEHPRPPRPPRPPRAKFELVSGAPVEVVAASELVSVARDDVLMEGVAAAPLVVPVAGEAIGAAITTEEAPRKVMKILENIFDWSVGIVCEWIDVLNE